MSAVNGKPATIKEVAQVAGVGLGTVSRVLNNQPSVSDQTRERVLEAIDRLGYQPNLQARRLARGKTETVGFILGNRDFLDPFHAKMLTGVHKFFAETGHQVVYTSLSYSKHASSEGMVLPKIFSLRGVLDGVIVAGTNYPILLDTLELIGLPYVVFGNNLVNDGYGDHDSVSFDDEGGAADLAERLIQLGHRDIWYVGNVSLPWFHRRYKGYCKALTSHGLEPRSIVSASTGGSSDVGHSTLMDLLDSGEEVSAICCGNDAIAFGAVKAAHERGLNVPRDISVAGFDDRDFGTMTEPELTTVRPFLDQVGAECARMLLAKLNENTHQPGVVTSTEVIMRASTGPYRSG